MKSTTSSSAAAYSSTSTRVSASLRRQQQCIRGMFKIFPRYDYLLHLLLFMLLVVVEEQWGMLFSLPVSPVCQQGFYSCFFGIENQAFNDGKESILRMGLPEGCQRWTVGSRSVRSWWWTQGNMIGNIPIHKHCCLLFGISSRYCPVGSCLASAADEVLMNFSWCCITQFYVLCYAGLFIMK